MSEDRKVLREVEEVTEGSAHSVLPPGEIIYNGGAPASLRALFDSRSLSYDVGDRIPPWWSPRRDHFLFSTFLRSDWLSSAIYNSSVRLSSIPINVVPSDLASDKDRKIAAISEVILRKAWAQNGMKFCLDWQTQDNGAFMEIMGAGEPDGPIEPFLMPGTSNTYIYATGLRHLDSQNAQRTGDEEYPVLYKHRDSDGRERYYKFHKTRIMYLSQMPSPRANMFEVGFCGVSRCIQNVLHLLDIGVLKEEWLGSRPVSQLIFGKGISANSMEEAFELADMKTTAEGNTRYARMVFMGLTGSPEAIRAAELDIHDLKRLPEGYDEQTSVEIAVNLIAMSLGFDARELWPATVAGATRADATIQHLKTMRKTPGVWTQDIGRLLTEMWAPLKSKVVFDQQDDEMDRMKAENRKLRAEELQIRIVSGQIDRKVAFERQLENGDITEDQYKHLLKALEEEKENGIEDSPSGRNMPRLNPAREGSNATPSPGYEVQ